MAAGRIWRCPPRGAAQKRGMRTLSIWLGALVLAVAAQAQDFTTNLTAEERAAAGLEKLSPAELARLKAIVERYKAGEVAVVQQQAEQKVAAAEAKVRDAEAKSADDKKAGPSWLRALATLKKAEASPDTNEPLESRLAGDFKGWRRGTIFVLENGQRWQHVEGEDYVTPPMPAPRVWIKPGVLGTFWLQIEGVRPRVKVKPLNLE